MAPSIPASVTRDRAGAAGIRRGALPVTGRLGLAILVVLLAGALVGPTLTLDPYAQDLGRALEGPSPNVVAPNRRANIGHSPLAVLKDGKLMMSLGSPGGDTIRQTVFQTVVNVIDFGLNIQQAIEAPRFSADPLTNSVRLEPRISAEAIAELERRGHAVTRTAPWGGPGTLEGFTIDPATGARMAGYDPRANSIAIAW